MKEALNEIVGWSFPLVVLILVVLSATRKSFPGKPWLIAHLGVLAGTMLGFRIPSLLLWSPNLNFDIGYFYETYGLALNIIQLAGFVFLIPFIFAVARSTQGGVMAAPGGDLESHQETLIQTKPMTIPQALFSFEGRMCRGDYWLKGFLVLLPVSIFNNILAYGVDHDGARAIAMVIGIASLWPGLALIVKRLHDRNRSGWFAATLLIPFVNIIFAIWIIVEVWFLRGTIGPNRFGADPLQEATTAAQQE